MSGLDLSDPAFWIRGGWIARGLSYGGAGLLAFSLGSGLTSIHGEPTQKGALELIGDLPLGQILLLILASGLSTFALWEITTLFQAERSTPMDWIDNIGKVIGVGFYGLLALSAIQSAFGESSESGSTVNRLSRFALRYPLGRVAVGIAGVVVILIALRRARRVKTGDFDDSLQTEKLSAAHAKAVDVLGRIGEAGRFLSFAIIGTFVFLAGLHDDGDKAKGLDRSLFELTDTAWGRVTVALVGVGFIAYGAFCALSAPARRLPSDI